jgi:ATP adenylyltransferase
MDRLWAPWRMEYILSTQDDDQGCIFCEKPQETTDKENLIVYRSEYSFVIMNKYPYNNGHVMVVPYIHESDYLNLTEDILVDMQRLLQLSIRALNETMHPHGINIGINLGRTAGAGIDEHLHYHLVPRWNGDTNFMPVLSGTKLVSESLAASWEKLHTSFKKITSG